MKKITVISFVVLAFAVVALAQTSTSPAPSTAPSVTSPATSKPLTLTPAEARSYERIQRLITQTERGIIDAKREIAVAEKKVAEGNLTLIQYLQIRDSLRAEFNRAHKCADCTVDDSSKTDDLMQSEYTLVPAAKSGGGK